MVGFFMVGENASSNQLDWMTTRCGRSKIRILQELRLKRKATRGKPEAATLSGKHRLRLCQHIVKWDAVQQTETGMPAEALAARRGAGEATEETGELA